MASPQFDHDAHARLLTHVADTISAGAILGTFAGFLPPLAALVATLWYLVQIWESHTVQKWWRLMRFGRRTATTKRRRTRLAKQFGRVVKRPTV